MTPAALRRQVALVGTALLAGLFVVVLGRPAEEAVPPVPPPVSTPRWQSAVVSVTRLRPETACEAGATGVAGVVHPVLPCGVKLEVSANGKDLRTEIVGLGPVAAGTNFAVTRTLAAELGIGDGDRIRWRFAG